MVLDALVVRFLPLLSLFLSFSLSLCLSVSLSLFLSVSLSLCLSFFLSLLLSVSLPFAGRQAKEGGRASRMMLG